MSRQKADISPLIEDPLTLACDLWDRGDNRGAFKLFSVLAAGGDSAAQLNLGYCFDCGLGVRKNQAKALYWYRRAYANGDSCGANNIGTIYRDRGQQRRALDWFERAVKMGEVGALLEIARIHLRAGNHLSRARRYLTKVSASDAVSEFEQEEAATLLDQMDAIRNRGPQRP